MEMRMSFTSTPTGSPIFRTFSKSCFVMSSLSPLEPSRSPVDGAAGIRALPLRTRQSASLPRRRSRPPFLHDRYILSIYLFNIPFVSICNGTIIPQTVTTVFFSPECLASSARCWARHGTTTSADVHGYRCGTSRESTTSRSRHGSGSSGEGRPPSHSDE